MLFSPSTETAYLEAAWSGISNLNNYPLEGVVDTEVDLEEFKLYFFTPETPKGKKSFYGEIPPYDSEVLSQ